MDRAVAKHICISALQTVSRLQQIRAFAEQHCGSADNATISAGVDLALSKLQSDILDAALAQYPDLRQEMEASIARYGVFI